MINRENTGKKYIYICILLLLMMGLFSSLAFNTESITTDNIITFGSLRLQLINNTMDAAGSEVAVEYEKEKLETSNVSRIIKVKNVCENSMFVRVKVDLKGKDSQTLFDAASYVQCNFSDNRWEKRDEWYYYLDTLEPDEVTSNLLDGLVFDLDKLTSDHAGSTIVFEVSAEAVQSEYNGENALEAEGWP